MPNGWAHRDPDGRRDALEPWLAEARKRLVPALRKSAVYMALCPPDGGDPDPKFCLELGMALMMDKPILVIVQQGRTIPPRLRLVADEVIEDVAIDSNADMTRVQAAIDRLLPHREERRP